MDGQIQRETEAGRWARARGTCSLSGVFRRYLFLVCQYFARVPLPCVVDFLYFYFIFIFFIVIVIIIGIIIIIIFYSSPHPIPITPKGTRACDLPQRSAHSNLVLIYQLPWLTFNDLF